MLQYKRAKDPIGTGVHTKVFSGKFAIAVIHYFDDHSDYEKDYYWSFHYFLDGMFDSLIIPDRKFKNLDACKGGINKLWSKFLINAELRNGH